MIREDDARLREAFDIAFTDDPPSRSTWADVVRRTERPVRRHWRRTRILALAVLTLLAVPAVLLADQVWQLGVGSTTPTQVRPLLGAGVNVGNASPIAYLARARVVARAELAHGDIYLVEAPGRYPPGLPWHGRIRCFWLMASFRSGDGSAHRVLIDGHALWVGPLQSCAGVEKAPASYELLGAGGFGHTAVAYGLVHERGITISARRRDGTSTKVPTRNGWYLAVLREGGAPNGAARLVYRDAHGDDISPRTSRPTR